MDDRFLLVGDVRLRRDDLPELLRRLLALLGALLEAWRRHEALEQRVEGDAGTKHRRQQQLECPHERRKGEGETRRGREAERSTHPLHDHHDDERARERGERAAPPLSSHQAERSRQRSARHEVGQHARQRERTMRALASAQDPDDGRGWLRVGVAPEQRAIGRGRERREHHRAGGEEQRSSRHARASAERTSRSWRRHMGEL